MYAKDGFQDHIKECGEAVERRRVRQVSSEEATEA